MHDFPEFKGPMADWPRVEAVDGIVDTLAYVQQKLICCLASNAGDSDAELMGLALERVNVRRYFHYLFTSKELGARKPDPDFYIGILKILNIKPQECVAVGNDYEKDIAPAKSVGMRTIWFSLISPSKAGSSADFAISSMKDLASVLEKI